MRWTGVSLALLAAAMAAALWFQSAKLRQLEQAIQQLTAKQLEAQAAASLELQGKCSDQARKAFMEMAYTPQETVLYQSHYNQHMNRCFMRVAESKTGPGTFSEMWWIYDAFEGRLYARYSATHDVRKASEITVLDCFVTLPSSQTTKCGSDAEFTKLASVYMER